MIRLLLLIFIGLGLMAPLAACGKKGPPELPPGLSDDYPRKYPND